ncbi:restriction endonuclease subunit S [Arcobacter vandammei]|uniref:restriction endonuclease subunit S n=1 Tax=Arcobacter vandammei TaxID=2782243 RepID=UPI0018E0568B|nr:restriction endonuclease subunit S [Arcobacter vandammei]
MSELYELPKGWEWKKLGELAKFQSGGTPSRSNKAYWENGDIPWVKISDITDDMYVSKTEEFITKSGLDNSSAKLFSKGTILYTIFATIGKIGILDIEATTNQAISGIQPNENIDLFYMYYGLKFITNEIQKISVGVAQNNINLTKLKEQWFPLPPLEEQKRIVEKLDLLFAKIDKAILLHQKNIDESDIFMASVLNDIFEELEEKYEKKYLDNIAFLIDGDRGVNYPKKEEFFEDEFCLFLNAKNVTKNGFIFLENQFITKEKDNILRKGKLDREDLIITTRGTIGNVAIYDKSINFDNIRINSGMAIIRLKDKNSIYNRYIYKYLFSPQFINYLKDVQSGSAQPQITIKNLKEAEVSLPPLETQQKVVSYLDEISSKIEKIKELQKSKMQSLKELKASILDKAFKGLL